MIGWLLGLRLELQLEVFSVFCRHWTDRGDKVKWYLPFPLLDFVSDINLTGLSFIFQKRMQSSDTHRLFSIINRMNKYD